MTDSDFSTLLDELKDRCAAATQAFSCVCQREPGEGKSFAVLSPDQAAALYAMVGYVALEAGRSEFGVERDLANAFCVPSLKRLPAEDFDRALRYLADQVKPPLTA